MAFPPRFGMTSIPQTTFVPVYGPPMIPVMQTASYLVPTMPGGVLASVNPRGGGGGRPRRPLLPHEQRQAIALQGSMDKPPATTVFVGNITEKATNDLIKTMLAKCGTVLQWKRVQGPTGRFQAFGFCEYEHPDSTLRAVRLLHEWKLGDKSLMVKVDEKTKEVLRDYVNKRRQAQGKPALKFEGDQLPSDEDMEREDESLRKSLHNVVNELGPDLVEGSEGVAKPRTPELYGKGGNLDIGSLDRERKEYIAREISSFRQTYMDDNKDGKKDRDRDRERDRDRHHRRHEHKREEKSTSRKKASPSPAPNVPQQQQQPMVKSRPESRSSTATGGRVRSQSPQELISGLQNAATSSGGGWNKGRRRGSTPDVPANRGSGRGQRRSTRSRSRADSDDDEASLERRRLERKMREKEASYLERLNSWENRERKRGREYDRERLKQKVQRREENREAKKLKEFLEDYDDERDDLKYYKGKSYDLRRRDYEKELEADNRDRQREKEEFEEIRKKLLEEGISDPEVEIAKIQKEQDEKLLKRQHAGDSSESPSPVHQRVRRSGSDDEGAASSTENGPDDGESRRGEKRRRDEEQRDDEAKKSRFVPTIASAPTSKPFGFAGLKLSTAATTSSATIQDDVDDEEEERKKAQSRRLVPLEYTEEEKKAIDDLVAEKATSSKSAPSADEKKKITKAIIDKIPTAKEELFAYPIAWNHVDQSLIDRRLKPWVTKKIVEYIGEDEQSLVEFICQKISQKTPPQTIIDDISMVLDEEAGVFVVKLWRLLIYEIESKKLNIAKTDGAS